MSFLHDMMECRTIVTGVHVVVHLRLRAPSSSSPTGCNGRFFQGPASCVGSSTSPALDIYSLYHSPYSQGLHSIQVLQECGTVTADEANTVRTALRLVVPPWIGTSFVCSSRWCSCVSRLWQRLPMAFKNKH